LALEKMTAEKEDTVQLLELVSRFKEAADRDIM
jgi:hypothetical protein